MRLLLTITAMLTMLSLMACETAPRTHSKYGSERGDDRTCRGYVKNSEEGRKATSPEELRKIYDECRQDLIDFNPPGGATPSTTVIINTR